MVKHTQTIRRLLPTNCLSVFDNFVGLALKGLSCNETNLFSRFITEQHFVNSVINSFHVLPQSMKMKIYKPISSKCSVAIIPQNVWFSDRQVAWNGLPSISSWLIQEWKGEIQERKDTFTDNNKNTITIHELCSKLTIKTSKQCSL